MPVDRDRGKTMRKARKRRRKAERSIRLGKPPPKKGRRLKIKLSPGEAKAYREQRDRRDAKRGPALQALDDGLDADHASS